MRQIKVRMGISTFNYSYLELYKKLGFKNPDGWVRALSIPKISTQNTLILGCGTGNLLVPLFDHGYNVTGIDCNPMMCEFLRKIRHGVNIVESRIEKWNNTKQFDFVLAPSCLLNNCINKTRKGIIARLANLLNCGAKVGFELLDWDFFRLKSQYIESNIEVLVEKLNHEKRLMKWQVKYKFKDVEFIENVSSRLFTLVELKRLLKPFGLSYEKSVACSTITTIVIFACTETPKDGPCPLDWP